MWRATTTDHSTHKSLTAPHPLLAWPTPQHLAGQSSAMPEGNCQHSTHTNIQGNSLHRTGQGQLITLQGDASCTRLRLVLTAMFHPGPCRAFEALLQVVWKASLRVLLKVGHLWAVAALSSFFGEIYRTLSFLTCSCGGGGSVLEGGIRQGDVCAP